MTSGVCWEAAEIDRLLYAHRLDVVLAAGPLGLSIAEAGQLARGEVAGGLITADRRCHAALLLNVLVRVELRCGHDPVAIRAALERPLDALDGTSIADRLRAGPDLAGLHALRAAAGTMQVPKVKMWRTPDRYS